MRDDHLLSFGDEDNNCVFFSKKRDRFAKGKADDWDDDDDFEAVLHPEGPLSNANFLRRGGSNLLKEKW